MTALGWIMLGILFLIMVVLTSSMFFEPVERPHRRDTWLIDHLARKDRGRAH